jgi:probable rRNA maturation factor
VILEAANKSLRMIPRPILEPYLRKRPKPCEIGIVIVSSAVIHKLNKKYRMKDRPTDVLSFSDLEVTDVPRGPFIGEIFICWSVAQKQAKESRLSIKNEIRQLTVHGILHLFGYDHEISPREAKRMFNLQDKILSTL